MVGRTSNKNYGKEGAEKRESDGWKWTFSDVPKYEKGEEIDYTIQIGAVSGYRVKISKNEVRLIYDKKAQTLPPETGESESEEPDTEEPETETQSSENKRPETEAGSPESESVKTGDTSNVEMYLLLFMTAVLVGGGAVIYRRKRV